MDDRNSVVMTDESEISIVDGIKETVTSYTVGPIIANGDPIGAVIILSKDKVIGDVEQKAVETAASFFWQSRWSSRKKRQHVAAFLL
ncbi:hypothetical protein GCM10020331_018780 [Ectobacillus funiculus]